LTNPQHWCQEYRFGYFTKKQKKEIFSTGIAWIDMEYHSSESYNFGPGIFFSEPVFVKIPGYDYSPETGKEPGWLLQKYTRVRYKELF
jgi:carotenoid cleavage dioxygenase-like enzyme